MRKDQRGRTDEREDDTDAMNDPVGDQFVEVVGAAKLEMLGIHVVCSSFSVGGDCFAANHGTDDGGKATSGQAGPPSRRLTDGNLACLRSDDTPPTNPSLTMLPPPDIFMRFTILATFAALLAYCWFLLKVGQARKKFGVEAPKTTGHADFERIFRVQQNTVEQLVLFLPSLWIFGFYVSDILAGLLVSAGRRRGRFMRRVLCGCAQARTGRGPDLPDRDRAACRRDDRGADQGRVTTELHRSILPRRYAVHTLQKRLVAAGRGLRARVGCRIKRLIVLNLRKYSCTRCI